MKTMMKKGMLALTSAACMLACAVPFGQAVSTGTAYIKPNAAAVQGQIGYLLGDLDFNNRVDMNDISILLDAAARMKRFVERNYSSSSGVNS